MTKIASITRCPPSFGRGSIMLHDNTKRCIGLITILQTDNIEAHAALLDQVESALSDKLRPKITTVTSDKEAEAYIAKRDRSIQISDNIVWSVAQNGFYDDQTGLRITDRKFYDEYWDKRDQFPQVPNTREIIDRIQRNEQRKSEDR